MSGTPAAVSVLAAEAFGATGMVFVFGSATAIFPGPVCTGVLFALLDFGPQPGMPQA